MGPDQRKEPAFEVVLQTCGPRDRGYRPLFGRCFGAETKLQHSKERQRLCGGSGGGGGGGGGGEGGGAGGEGGGAGGEGGGAAGDCKGNSHPHYRTKERRSNSSDVSRTGGSHSIRGGTVQL